MMFRTLAKAIVSGQMILSTAFALATGIYDPGTKSLPQYLSKELRARLAQNDPLSPGVNDRLLLIRETYQGTWWDGKNETPFQRTATAEPSGPYMKVTLEDNIDPSWRFVRYSLWGGWVTMNSNHPKFKEHTLNFLYEKPGAITIMVRSSQRHPDYFPIEKLMKCYYQRHNRPEAYGLNIPGDLLEYYCSYTEAEKSANRKQGSVKDRFHFGYSTYFGTIFRLDSGYGCNTFIEYLNIFDQKISTTSNKCVIHWGWVPPL